MSFQKSAGLSAPPVAGTHTSSVTAPSTVVSSGVASSASNTTSVKTSTTSVAPSVVSIVFFPFFLLFVASHTFTMVLLILGSHLFELPFDVAVSVYTTMDAG